MLQIEDPAAFYDQLREDPREELPGSVSVGDVPVEVGNRIIEEL